MKERNSSFELMRIIAQYMIVLYHIFLFWFVKEGTQTASIYKIIWIPLHIAVPLYVLVSGYFGIRFNVRGLMRIIFNCLVYSLLLYLICCFVLRDEYFDYKALFFVSNTPYWFIKTYVYLFLCAPILNLILRQITILQRIFLLGILLWMNCWIGLMNFDSSLYGGKTLVYFVFLYLIGDTLHVYKDKINHIPLWFMVLLFVVINSLSIFGGWLGCQQSFSHTRLFNLCYLYTSPLIVIQAILFFALFMRMTFVCTPINYMAKSCLAIYLIHGSNLVFRHWIRDGAFYIVGLTQQPLLHILYVALFSLIIVIGCIIIDKLLTPLWNLSDKISIAVEHNSYLNKYLQAWR